MAAVNLATKLRLYVTNRNIEFKVSKIKEYCSNIYKKKKRSSYIGNSATHGQQTDAVSCQGTIRTIKVSQQH